MGNPRNSDSRNSESTNEIINTIKSMFTEMMTQMKEDNERSYEVLKSEIFDLNQKCERVEKENRLLKEKNNKLEERMGLVKAQTDCFAAKLNDMEQEKLSNGVNIINNSETFDKKIFSVCDNFHINDVSFVKTLKTKNSGKFLHNIIVKNDSVKNNLFKNKKKLRDEGNSIFESLTKFNQNLLAEAKNLVSLKILFSSWSYKGSIFVKLSETDKPRRIKLISDLDNLVRKND